MAQPTPYSRQYNFTNYQTVSPSAPLPAAQVDLELNSVKLTLDQVLNNLKILQRDDTAFANNSIGYDQLKAELNGFGFNPPTNWVTLHNYVVRDTVFQSAKFYQCLVSHVSGTFATDLAAGDWLLIADFNVNPVEVQTVAAAAVTTLGDTDLIANVQTTGPTLKKITVLSFKTWLVAALGPLFAALTAKATPVDADGVMLVDSAASNAPKFLSIANLKAALLVYLIGKRVKRKNREWNPACEVSQQNGGTLGTSSGYFPSDNLAMYFTASTAAVSVQQIAGPTLNGSAHQIEFKCTTAKVSLGASDYVSLTTKIEGLNVADLKWGTANAIPATRSFQFKGPAGTYHLHGQNRSGNRHIAIPFSPAVANTEERITVVIPGDVTGTWAVDNDTLVTWDIILAAGATLTGGSASAWSGSTFYAASAQKNILDANTNVVRVGDFDFSPDPDSTGAAPAWEPVDIGQALRDAQRYYLADPQDYLAYPDNGSGSAARFFSYFFPVDMATLRSVTLTVSAGSVSSTQTARGFAATITGIGTGTCVVQNIVVSARLS